MKQNKTKRNQSQLVRFELNISLPSFRPSTWTHIGSDEMNLVLPSPMLVDVLIRLNLQSILVRDQHYRPPGKLVVSSTALTPPPLSAKKLALLAHSPVFIHLLHLLLDGPIPPSPIRLSLWPLRSRSHSNQGAVEVEEGDLHSFLRRPGGFWGGRAGGGIVQ